MKEKLKKIYDKLLEEYGHQGWWPLLGEYHLKDYSHPKNRNEQFEIIIGALLTQNTAWTSVEKSLANLNKLEALTPDGILELNLDDLKSAIRPSGYNNTKSERLKLLAEWFIKNEGIPSREELLKLKGIGPETADSILLYAYSVPSFVVDAYTRRILSGLGIIEDTINYNDLKNLFENNLSPDFRMFQEFHALLVEHAKRIKSGGKDFLK
ncbi:endonuclease III domain-containing protein [Candidatus Pacearchaeota archaeon]|nr:endonuclease III domain-containing protein [Candidatus Pacearchaeota archaeon]